MMMDGKINHPTVVINTTLHPTPGSYRTLYRTVMGHAVITYQMIIAQTTHEAENNTAVIREITNSALVHL